LILYWIFFWYKWRKENCKRDRKRGRGREGTRVFLWWPDRCKHEDKPEDKYKLHDIQWGGLGDKFNRKWGEIPGIGAAAVCEGVSGKLHR
jgi:hypothetical protein